MIVINKFIFSLLYAFMLILFSLIIYFKKNVNEVVQINIYDLFFLSLQLTLPIAFVLFVLRSLTIEGKRLILFSILLSFFLYILNGGNQPFKTLGLNFINVNVVNKESMGPVLKFEKKKMQWFRPKEKVLESEDYIFHFIGNKIQTFKRGKEINLEKINRKVSYENQKQI